MVPLTPGKAEVMEIRAGRARGFHAGIAPATGQGGGRGGEAVPSRPVGRVHSGTRGQPLLRRGLGSWGFGPLASGAFRSITKGSGRRAELAPGEGWGLHLHCGQIQITRSKTPLGAGVITV